MSKEDKAGPVSDTSRPGASVFRVPLALAAITCVGLVSGLLGDGLLDGVAWFGLGVPVLVCVYKCT